MEATSITATETLRRPIVYPAEIVQLWKEEESGFRIIVERIFRRTRSVRRTPHARSKHSYKLVQTQLEPGGFFSMKVTL